MPLQALTRRFQFQNRLCFGLLFHYSHFFYGLRFNFSLRVELSLALGEGLASRGKHPSRVLLWPMVLHEDFTLLSLLLDPVAVVDSLPGLVQNVLNRVWLIVGYRDGLRLFELRHDCAVAVEFRIAVQSWGT